MIDNTKLIELAKEAGYGTQITLFADGGQREDIWGGQFETRKLEKFTKLIVQECANVIDRGDGEMSGMAETIWCNICRDDILKHFGVKE